MTADAVDALLAEVRSDLQDDLLGLYEFIWTLNTMRPDLGHDAKLSAADEVLRRLMAEGDYRLVWEMWAQPEYSEPAGDIWPSRGDWGDPEEGKPYLVIEAAGGPIGRTSASSSKTR